MITEPTTESQTFVAMVGDIPVHYAALGDGVPLVALHGWMVDHHYMTGMLEPLLARRPGYRRIYPDLPGMGRTPAPDSIASSDDMLDVALAFIDTVVDRRPFLLIGHSHGGYLARAIAGRLPEAVAGLALINPLGGEVIRSEVDTPPHVVLHASGNLEGMLDPALDAEYPGYLVVQTPETLRRFAALEGPGMALADVPALERIHQQFALRDDPGAGPPFPNPTLILTGRQDAFVGYAAQWGWLDHYPRAAYAVLDRAGHGLPHEQVGLLEALVGDWLDRVAETR